MLLRDKKKKTLKVWEVHSLVHPLLMEGAGQWTRCGTNECMYGWDASGFEVSMLRPATKTVCGSLLQLFYNLNFCFLWLKTLSHKLIWEFPLVMSNPEYYPAFINHWVWAVSSINTRRHMLDKDSSEVSSLIQNSLSRKKSKMAL